MLFADVWLVFVAASGCAEFLSCSSLSGVPKLVFLILFVGSFDE